MDIVDIKFLFLFDRIFNIYYKQYKISSYISLYLEDLYAREFIFIQRLFLDWVIFEQSFLINMDYIIFKHMFFRYFHNYLDDDVCKLWFEFNHYVFIYGDFLIDYRFLQLPSDLKYRYNDFVYNKLFVIVASIFFFKWRKKDDKRKFFNLYMFYEKLFKKPL